MTKPNGYVTKDLSSAKEFFDLFYPYSKSTIDWSSHIFRGHRDAFWRLEPKVIRESFYNQTKLELIASRVADQLQLEFKLLSSFLEHCDVSGLPIQGDSLELRGSLQSSGLSHFVSAPRLWPLDGFLIPLAVAQHHGLSTRLLDWTKNPFIALFFAAEHSWGESRPDPDDRICVWAMKACEVQTHLPNLEIIPVPRSASKNLAAQYGVFSLLRETDPAASECPRKTLEGEFKRVLDYPDSSLMKITIPARYCGEILSILENRFAISRTSLFPGYESAALDAIEEAMSDAPRTLMILGSGQS